MFKSAANSLMAAGVILFVTSIGVVVLCVYRLGRRAVDALRATS